MSTSDKSIDRLNILDQAKAIIYGDREKTYGKPDINLKNIADHWTIYLRSKIKNDTLNPLTTDDVCYMMVLLKIARLQNDPKHLDSMTDAVGYLALAERVQGFHEQELEQFRSEHKKDMEQFGLGILSSIPSF